MTLRSLGVWFSAVALPWMGYYLLAASGLARLVDREVPMVDLERCLLGGLSAPERVAPMMGVGAVNVAMVATYLSFYVVLLGLPAWILVRRHLGVFRRLRAVWAWIAVVGYPLYFLIPTRSPYYSLDLYNHPPFGLSQTLALGALNGGVAFEYDAFPSLHVAYALAAVLVVMPILSARSRGLAVAWLGALHLSTLATGSHYLLDLVAGDLLAVMVWAGERLKPRS